MEHVNRVKCIKCPCIRCGCLDKVTVEVLKDHLFINEIDKDYAR